MAVKVRIPTPLQRLTANQAEVEVEGKNIREILDALEEKFPGIKERICDENGKVRKFVNLFVNDEDARFLQGEETELKDGDSLSIVPAIAGGKLKLIMNF